MKSSVVHSALLALILATVALAPGVQGIAHGQPSVEAGRIYWTEAKDLGWIQRADLDGSNVESLLTTELQIDPRLLALDWFGNKLYWTEWNRESQTGTIRRADLDGANVETFVTGEGHISAIALDWFGDKMYWTEWDTGTIRRADVDGSNVKTLVMGIGSPLGIALDAHEVDVYWPDASKKMYWTEWDTGTIRRADVDGSNVETLVTGEESIVAFALDWGWGKMYWTGWNSDSETGTLRWADVDGNNVEVITEIEKPRVLAVDFFDERGTLYWSELDSNTIQRSHRGGSHRGSISLGLEGPGSIAVDVAGDRMYWVDKRRSSIRRANLDGTDVEDLVTGVEDPRDIALDLVAGRMYWTERGTGTIRRTDLDGTDVEDLVTGIESSEGIALEVTVGKMYWTARGASRFPDAGVIQRSNLDGSNVETLVAGLRDPVEIALDQVAGKMYYWVGGSYLGGGSIHRSNLDGSSGEVLVTRLVGPVEIALDIVEGKMYWADKGTGTIRRADLDGTNVEALVTGLVRPVGIALDVPPPITTPDTEHDLRTEVEATVLGAGVEGLTIEFARAATDPLHFAWSATTDTAGRLALTITSPDGVGVSDLYQARARTAAGEVVGQWDGIPLDRGCRQILELTLAGGARVVASERLDEPNPDRCANGIAVANPLLNRGLVEDCRALLAFRDSRDSVSDLNWGAATPIALWTGLEVCNSRVRSISITDYAFYDPRPFIPGPISSELGQLTALEYLYLPGLILEGPIPPELGRLTKLRELHLNDNELTGPIPPELGQLTALEHLYLRGNALTDSIPSELSQLTQVTRLDLSWNELTGPIPPELGQLTKLQELNLQDNQFSCVPEALAKWVDDLPVCTNATDSVATTPDFDGDGVTGFADFFLFADAFGGSDPRFDLDGSGAVDFADFFLFVDAFDQPAQAKLLVLAQELIGLPDGPQLQQNAPNPFNRQTVISYFLLAPGPARLELFALTGQRVAVLSEGQRKAGRHRLHWDGRDDAGRPLASGIYLYRLVTGEGVLTRKLILLR